MTGLIVAVAILGVVVVSAIVVGATLIRRLTVEMTLLTECFLKFVNNPDSVRIIEDYEVTGNKEPSFPNSEGF